MSTFSSRNHLANILCHEKDFGIKVICYNFFATGHGKTELDGEGGTVKRSTTRHNIRSSPSDQVTTPKEMYEFVCDKMKNTK